MSRVKKEAPGRMSSMCKGPEADSSMTCSRKVKLAFPQCSRVRGGMGAKTRDFKGQSTQDLVGHAVDLLLTLKAMGRPSQGVTFPEQTVECLP